MNSWGEPRTRTLTWYDPSIAEALGRGMSGLQFLEAMRTGALAPPPISDHFRMQVVSASVGDVVFSAQPDESAYNGTGSVHGGFVCTLLDTVTGCAVHTTLPVTQWNTTVELKVSFLRAIRTESGELTARGRVVKPGRRVAFAEGEVRDAAGVLLATASATFAVLNTDDS
jgi:uncharacterized protein (TIGR00369 family)